MTSELQEATVSGSGPNKTSPGQSAPDRNPGDEARPGSKQSGDQVCPACDGTGRVDEAACPDCGGTGRVTVIVGDA